MDADVLLVADDLTGAMDTAHGFAARGHETIVCVTEADDTTTFEVSVLAIDTDTRYADAAEARRTVTRAVSAHDRRCRDSPTVYKKVDSTLRGNVLAELEAALEVTDVTAAVVAPAFPSTGRTTRGGVHAVDGVPLDETEYAADEKGVATAHLPTLFSDAHYPASHVALEDVEAGPAELTAVVRERVTATTASVILTFDATRPSHLESIADAAAACGERILYVGSGGLARHVTIPTDDPNPTDDRETIERARGSVPSKADGPRPALAESETATDETATGETATGETVSGERATSGANDARAGVLAVVGSVDDRTLTQLEAVPSDAVVELEPARMVTDPGRTGRRAGVRAAERLASDEPVVLTGARSRAALEETLSVGRAAGYEPAAVRIRVQRALAEAARTAVDAQPPVGTVLTGGAVAVAVCDALEATAIVLTGDEVTDGVPRGVVATGPLAGTPVVTKAGGFGDESTIGTCLNRLGDSDTK